MFRSSESSNQKYVPEILGGIAMKKELTVDDIAVMLYAADRIGFSMEDSIIEWRFKDKMTCDRFHKRASRLIEMCSVFKRDTPIPKEEHCAMTRVRACTRDNCEGRDDFCNSHDKCSKDARDQLISHNEFVDEFGRCPRECKEETETSED